MKKETIQRILTGRRLKSKDGGYDIPENEVASLLIGQSTVTALPGVRRVTLADDHIVVETRKGSCTYLEYELVRAVAFENKEIADRQAGFV